MRSAAFLAFFLSGASSLIFQSIWGRMLAHVFGASSVAISTVVTIFMAGLGLGAFLAGKVADRIKNPLLAYGVVEAMVGAWALLVPTLLDPEGWLAGVNSTLHNEFGAGSASFMVARFFCVLPVLLIPTTLMGTSLPLLSRHFVSRAEGQADVGSWVGALYSVNTFGAVGGVLLGSFVLMPLIGISLTNTAAACINFGLAAMIFALRKFLTGADEAPVAKKDESASKPLDRAKAPEPAPEPPREPNLGMPIPAIARPFAFFAFAVSGLASLCYEVVWSRALAMTIGSSFQSFALILTTFLIGIGGGSAVASGVLAGRRLLPTAGIASIILVVLSASVWGVQDDLGMFALISVLFSLPIVVIWIAVRSRRNSRPDALGGAPPVKAALLMLVVPVASALLNVVLFTNDRVALIAAAVTACLAAFLGIILALRRYPVLQLAMMPLFIAVAAFVNYLFQDEIPCVFAQLVSTLDDLPEHVGTVRFFMFVTTALCTLPATAGMGAMFPMTLRIWTSGGDSVGRDVGNVYAGNTLGAIVGAWLPGFVLMQTVGLERTILVGMFVYLGVSLIMLIVSAAEVPESDVDRVKKGASLKGALEAADLIDGDDTRDVPDPDAEPKNAPPAWYAVVIYILAPLIPALIAGLVFGGWRDDGAFRWNLSQMTLGVFRVSLAADACSDNWGEPDLVYYHDGLSTTVSVERWGRHYALKNNGKVDASNGDDMPTQIMVAAYPLMMHERGPTDLDVAIIGFGSGVTVGTALKFPVASVDVIELERSIPDASKYFQDVNGLSYVLEEFPYVEADRLTVINDDGRNYLSSTDREFDVIISEPSNPWITGVSDLFTTDHFRITKQRLREGGIYCQWVQLYELSPENIKTIYRTFASSFEYVVVFAAEDLSSDTVLLGSDSPLPLDIERIRAVHQLRGISEELERAYIHSPYDVFARTLLASRDEVLQFSQIESRLRGGEWISYPDSSNPPDRGCPEATCRRTPAPLNTDDNALIEFAAPRDLIGYQRYEGYLANIYSSEWPYGRLVEHATGFGEADEAADQYAEMAMALIAHGRKPEAAAFITRAQDAGNSNTTRVAAEVLTRLMTNENEPTVSIETPVPGPQLAAREARQLTEGFAAVRQAVDSGSYSTALGAMEDIPAPVRLHSGPSLRLLYGYLLFKTASSYQSRYGEAVDQLEDLARTEPEYTSHHPELFYFLGRAHDADLHFDKALRNMRLFVEARIRAAREAEEEALQVEGMEGIEPPATDGETDDPEGARKALRESP